jgi:hypothetical protein
MGQRWSLKERTALDYFGQTIPLLALSSSPKNEKLFISSDEEAEREGRKNLRL